MGGTRDAIASVAIVYPLVFRRLLGACCAYDWAQEKVSLLNNGLNLLGEISTFSDEVSSF